jgi:RNA polymerase sigma factor (sigma-70 family)
MTVEKVFISPTTPAEDEGSRVIDEPLAADGVPMGGATGITTSPHRGAVLRSRRLLRLAGDDRLVRQVQQGSEAAFEVVFERYSASVLAFCRHMLGSPQEAEDALQVTFSAAYRDLQRRPGREVTLKPWLFTIARNNCLSVLRARRELPSQLPDLETAGLAEQVERRAELRALVADVRELPEDQRAALLLAEAGGLAHGEIAAVLGCEVARVKALVYRARSNLIARREARERPCHEVREQLANLRGGALRRTELRLHLRECPGCRDFREQVKRQRQLLAAALPVTPALGLKASVLGAIGIGGGAGGGGAAAAKVAVFAVIAAGGVAGGTAVVEKAGHAPPGRQPAQMSGAPAPAPQVTQRTPAVAPATAHTTPAGRDRATKPAPAPAEAVGRHMDRDGHEKRATPVAEVPPGEVTQGEHQSNGRGPVEHPHATPVKRGPREHGVKPPKQKLEPERQASAPRGRAPAHENNGQHGAKANGPQAPPELDD